MQNNNYSHVKCYVCVFSPASAVAGEGGKVSGEALAPGLTRGMLSSLATGPVRSRALSSRRCALSSSEHGSPTLGGFGLFKFQEPQCPIGRIPQGAPGFLWYRRRARGMCLEPLTWFLVRTPWSGVLHGCLRVFLIIVTITLATPCIYLILFSGELSSPFARFQEEEKDQGDEREPLRLTLEEKHPLF